MTLNKAISLRLSELLSERDMSIYKLIVSSGLDRDNLYRLVKGKNTDVKLSTISAICNTLNISIIDFFNSDKFLDIIQ